jgi:hypothetical protein
LIPTGERLRYGEQTGVSSHFSESRSAQAELKFQVSGSAVLVVAVAAATPAACA